MIDRIIDLSVRYRILVIIAVAVLAYVGWQSMMSLPLDALPDTGETQVIIRSTWDRSPDLVDSQVTYPIVSALLGTPGVKSVRGISDFGASFVYVIFQDDTDLNWARSRTTELLSNVLPTLPEGVRTEIGPDATSLSWVFQYVLVDRSGKHSLVDLRSYQDWYLRYHLSSVQGVAEVSTVGGFARQYQVNVDPNRQRAYGLSIQQVVEALKASNSEAGGRVVNSGGTESIVRGLGYLGSISDLEQTLVATTADGTAVRVKDIADVSIGSTFRRGIAELNGTGEVVSGIVLMRQGQNALDVIGRVKERIRQIEPSLPEGVSIVPIYDRSELVRQSIRNLKWTLIEVMVTVSLVIVLFLWHIPSAGVPLITIPLSILIAFIPFRLLGMSANIMSLGGIAIAVGAMVDASIVVVEQTHKRLGQQEKIQSKEEVQKIIVDAIKQVARPSFFAMLVIAISFLPILTLQAEEGRLFKPLAYTKSLAMVVAAVLAITLDPALRVLFTRVRRFQFHPAWLRRTANAILVGRIQAEDQQRLSRQIIKYYEPVVKWSLRNKTVVFTAAILLMTLTIPGLLRLGTEFMPPLDEGSILYMPTTMPGISEAEAGRLLQITDRRLKRFPEVQSVLGKAGRAETATDPAPLSMLETVIILKPTISWRKIPTWYSSWAPEWAKGFLRHITPDHISKDDLVAEMDDAVRLPGVSNSWSMPIRGRMDMLSTGIRSPVGIKISGTNVEQIEQIGGQIEKLLPSISGTRAVFAERAGHGFFLDIRWNREALARAGVTIDDAQAAVRYSIGGDDVTTIVAGRERYPVNVRYLPDFRADMEAIKHVLVQSRDGKRQVQLSEVADVRNSSGPAMLRNDNGLLTGYIFVDVADRDLSGYVEDADQAIRQLKLPAGSTVVWSGQFESITRLKLRLKQIVPLTLALIVGLLYLNTRSVPKTMIVLLAVPFSAIGAIWILYLLGYHLSIAVWVGLIALMGVDAETGVFMLLYLDHACEQAKLENRLQTRGDLTRAVLDGAARRVRPKFMTVVTMIVGLVPIMWSAGTGADVMKRIAAPMIGGILVSFVLELVVYPAIYHTWKTKDIPTSPSKSTKDFSTFVQNLAQVADR